MSHENLFDDPVDLLNLLRALNRRVKEARQYANVLSGEREAVIQKIRQFSQPELDAANKELKRRDATQKDTTAIDIR